MNVTQKKKLPSSDSSIPTVRALSRTLVTMEEKAEGEDMPSANVWNFGITKV